MIRECFCDMQTFALPWFQIMAVADQGALLAIALFAVFALRKLSNYVDEKARFFADMAIVILCVACGIVFASALHAEFFRWHYNTTANGGFFVLNAMVAIIGLFYVSDITIETFDIVCESCIAMTAIVILVVGIIGVLINVLTAITKEIHVN